MIQSSMLEAAQRLKSAAADNLELSIRGFQPSAAFELVRFVHPK
jgi:hypothetical protein